MYGGAIAYTEKILLVSIVHFPNLFGTVVWCSHIHVRMLNQARFLIVVLNLWSERANETLWHWQTFAAMYILVGNCRQLFFTLSIFTSFRVYRSVWLSFVCKVRCYYDCCWCCVFMIMMMIMMINITAALSLRARFNSCGLILFSLSFVVFVVVMVCLFSLGLRIYVNKTITYAFS